MTQMYHFEREGDVDLTFEGDVIADVSSEEPSKQFWTEHRIYKAVKTGKYVVETVGKARSGSPDRVSIIVADTPDAVREALKRRDTRRDSRPFLTVLAMDALEEAQEHDNAFGKVWEERI